MLFLNDSTLVSKKYLVNFVLLPVYYFLSDEFFSKKANIKRYLPHEPAKNFCTIVTGAISKCYVFKKYLHTHRQIRLICENKIKFWFPNEFFIHLRAWTTKSVFFFVKIFLNGVYMDWESICISQPPSLSYLNHGPNALSKLLVKKLWKCFILSL